MNVAELDEPLAELPLRTAPTARCPPEPTETPVPRLGGLRAVAAGGSSARGPDGLFFLDTNVLIYSFDGGAPEKQTVARRLIREALQSRRGMIGAQVVQEFMNVALKKFERPLGTSEAREYLRGVLQPLCQHYPTGETYDRALLIREETGYAWYDALVVAAAIEAGCARLLTEDLDAGRHIGRLTILNPFQ
jgi:predicted nucleic acid-binding protein